MSQLERANLLRFPSRTLSIQRILCRGLDENTGVQETKEYKEREISESIRNAIPLSAKELCVCLSFKGDLDVHLSAVLFHQGFTLAEMITTAIPNSTCGNIHHITERREAKGRSAGEIIQMNLTRIPAIISNILFIIHIRNELHSLADVKDGTVYLKLRKSYPANLWSIDLNRVMGNAAFVMLMTQENSDWYYRSLGVPVTGHTPDSILKNPVNLMCLRHESSAVPLRRRVHVRVLQGTGLAAKHHSSLLKTRFSNPYFVITFMGKKIKSTCRKRTLAPRWNDEPAFDLGNLSGHETDGLRIEVFHHHLIANDDFMGRIWIRGSDLYRYGPGKHLRWFSLGSSQKENIQNSSISGQIALQILVKDLC